MKLNRTNTNQHLTINEPARWADAFSLGDYVDPRGLYNAVFIAQDDYGYWCAAMRPMRAIYAGLALAYMGLIGLLFKQ